MNIKQKLLAVFAALILVLLAGCMSTGQYMSLSKDETVIGTAQATFAVRSSLFFMKSAKDAVNTQAYIKLLESAGTKYSGAIDVRDIVWVTGKSLDDQNTEVSATGKVVRVGNAD